MTWIGEGDSYLIQKNERIAQLLITPIPKSEFIEVSIDNLGETERGDGGFGSTGRFYAINTNKIDSFHPMA